MTIMVSVLPYRTVKVLHSVTGPGRIVEVLHSDIGPYSTVKVLHSVSGQWKCYTVLQGQYSDFNWAGSFHTGLAQRKPDSAVTAIANCLATL